MWTVLVSPQTLMTVKWFESVIKQRWSCLWFSLSNANKSVINPLSNHYSDITALLAPWKPHAKIRITVWRGNILQTICSLENTHTHTHTLVWAQVAQWKPVKGKSDELHMKQEWIIKSFVYRVLFLLLVIHWRTLSCMLTCGPCWPLVKSIFSFSDSSCADDYRQVLFKV